MAASTKTFYCDFSWRFRLDTNHIPFAWKQNQSEYLWCWFFLFVNVMHSNLNKCANKRQNIPSKSIDTYSTIHRNIMPMTYPIKMIPCLDNVYSQMYIFVHVPWWWWLVLLLFSFVYSFKCFICPKLSNPLNFVR